ncbi:MAG TPA: LCP family protein [Thermomicrobiales bacterium]|nr:LCP family protein [Thermomicrobiales bacterium]
MPDDPRNRPLPDPSEPTPAPGADDYLRRTIRRARRRNPASPDQETFRQRPEQRYAAYRNVNDPGQTAPRRRDQLPPRAALDAGATLPPSGLDAEFDVAERSQIATAKSRRKRSRRPRLLRKPWAYATLGIPATFLLVFLVIAAPLAYKSYNAYREIKVGPVEHVDSAKVAVVNAAGTPELAVAPTKPPSDDWTGTDRINILLLGVDNAEGGVSRTDTIIVVNIDPVAKKASMISIPRDLKVVIPGYGIDKINAAYALGEYNKVQGGGAGLLIRTIEANLGIPIDHFAQIDFAGFEKMIDTVGGITIDNPYPIKDDEYPAANYQYERIYFPAGWQHLNGAQALEYARTRHQDGDGRRSERQQQVLLALRDKAINLNMISKVPTLIDQFAQFTRTDISAGDALKLARLGASMNSSAITQYSLMPAMSDEQLPGEPYYLVADWSETGAILSQFTGTTVNPPGAALANPNFNLPILVENGTNNQGLAGRVGSVLEENGFTNVQVALTTDGEHQTTELVDNGGNLGTSATLANLIGVGADRIDVENMNLAGTATPGATPGLSTPSATPNPADPNQFAIVITLGDDAPDPGDSQWQIQDYQDQVGDDDTGDGPIATEAPTSNDSSDPGANPTGIPTEVPTEDPYSLPSDGTSGGQ